MDIDKYTKIIKEGERTEWYGVEVPLELINATIRLAADNLSQEIDKLESELDEHLKGSKYQSKKGYIDILKINLQNLPYTFNDDVLLAKKKKIEEEMKPKVEEKRKTKKRTTKSVKKDEVVEEQIEETTPKKTPKKKTGTKNSSLIFGKK